MASQIKAFLRLELCNLYGVNVFRFSRDNKAKGRTAVLVAAWSVLLLVLAVYVGGLSYGLIWLGMEEMVPAYLLVLSSLLPFVLNVFTTGSVLFRQEGYDMVCSLPVAKGAVVLSRFARMYVEHLLLTMAVLLPGLTVYLWNVRPGFACCLLTFLAIWFVPLLPMAAAALLGTLIAGVASRMRHKSLVISGLTILTVLGVFYGSSRIADLEDTINPEMLKEFSEVVFRLLGRLYPPSIWFGRAVVTGDIGAGLFYIGSSLLALGVVIALVTVCFHSIHQRLYSSLAKHNYQMGKLQESPVLAALCKREFRRYFSSSVYVSNTIVGPVMGCILSGGLLAAGVEVLEGAVPAMASFDIQELIPFVLAITFGIMPTTAVSISMEGKNWWLIKSLPISFRMVLDAKILMNLLLAVPFYLVAEILAVMALQPSASELFWLLLVPLVVLLFSSVFGMTVNLCFPVLDWENEISVVKQSAASLLGGLGGFVLAIVCVAAVALTPAAYTNWVKAALCGLLLLLTGWLYRKNYRSPLP